MADGIGAERLVVSNQAWQDGEASGIRRGPGVRTAQVGVERKDRAFARLDDGIPRIEEDFLRSVPWLPTFGLRFTF